MTTLYVSSVDGDDSTTPSVTWWNGSQPTYATVAGAIATLSVGDHIIYVDSAHEHAAAGDNSITRSAGTSGFHVAILSTDRNTGDRQAGAVEGTHGSDTGDMRIDTNNQDNYFYYVYGMTFKGGNTTGKIRVAAQLGLGKNHYHVYDECTFDVRHGSSTSWMDFGSTGNDDAPSIVLTDCTLGFNEYRAGLRANIEFHNLSLLMSGTQPSTRLFDPGSGVSYASIAIWDSDLTPYNTGGGSIFLASAKTATEVTLVNVKLDPNVDLLHSNGIADTNTHVTLVNTDSGDTNYTFEMHNRQGTLLETRTIYADDGAQFDEANIGWEITTASGCSEYAPFVTPWIHVWNADTVQKTGQIKIVHDSGTNLNDRDCWVELDYVKATDSTLGEFLNNRNAKPFDGTGVDWPTDTDTWQGTGGFTNENKQKIEHTFTPGKPAVIRARLVITAPSKTLYVDPKVRLT